MILLQKVCLKKIKGLTVMDASVLREPEKWLDYVLTGSARMDTRKN